jgi:hypothetical protein
MSFSPELPLQIGDDQPLQPMPPRQWLLRVVVHTADKERAHRTVGKSDRIHYHLGATTWSRQGHAMNHFVQSVRDGGFIQPPQESVQRGVVGNRATPQSMAQLRMFGQAYFGFAIRSSPRSA